MMINYYPGAVYSEGPPSFIRGEEPKKTKDYDSSLQLTYTF